MLGALARWSLARSKTGGAVPAARRTEVALAELLAFQREARESGALDRWLRASVVLHYVDGRRAVEIARMLDVGESTVHDWLGWYRREGVAGLRSAKRGRSQPKLGKEERETLAGVVEAGPLAAGFSSGMWTGKMIAAVIQATFGVGFHPQSVPRLLHEMGFSVQRPRKRLSRADPEAQAHWVRERLPTLKKTQRSAAG